ncbi:MAG: hypothetical protein JRH01_14290 [Deltaproteobacteria bacterium]|nr:hypothetical protein [Deltaproteobacteria bacterium]
MLFGSNKPLRLALGLLLISPAFLAATCGAPTIGNQLFAAPQADPVAISPTQARLYVVNTPASRLDVFSTTTNTRVASIQVGIAPSGVAVRPDGLEVWVTNHVSDSISVIDTDPTSATFETVVETIQSVDPTTLASLTDEPVGVVFASNSKAYVTLSSRNQIAVVDATTYSVTNLIQLSAQEPRAMRVAGGRLYVAVLESGNTSELSSCPNQLFPTSPQCTFDLVQANFATNPQFVGFDADIVKDPDLPDRDLFVYDTATDTQIDVISGVGTLLYGVAVDANGKVFITQTDARNVDNGRAGTAGEGLIDLENRIFLNQIARVDCSSIPCAAPSVIELEPSLPSQPAAGDQLATPYGVQVSGDGSILVATAAASDRFFTFDTATNQVLGRLDVGAIPRGVALASNGSGVAQTAYVLNTMESTVSVIDVSNPSAPVELTRMAMVDDPTSDSIRRGRIAFNTATASTSGTFSCASCHPDGNTDQLLWVIGAQCTFAAGCDQEEARSTMPVRGLRDTLPLHWDGVLGDPFGGSNGEVGSNGSAPANCTDEHSCFRHLVDAAISGVMCEQTGCPTNVNELGLAGELSEAERDDMAVFLRSVSYPPPRSRPLNDVVSTSALAGFDQFYLDQPGSITVGPETCADAPGGCHALPFGAGTNAFFVGGMDAPTMRGITDRFLIFSAGVTLVEEQLQVSDPASPFFNPNQTDVDWLPDSVGFDELTMWAQAFGTAAQEGAFRSIYKADTLDTFQMTEEASNGHPAGIGRQLTLNTRTTNNEGLLAEINATLDVLELADADGTIVLRGQGERNGSDAPFNWAAGAGYVGPGVVLSRAALIAEAAAGTTLLTFTARLPAKVQPGAVQPALAVPPVTDLASGGLVTGGRPDLPVLPGPMDVDGLHILTGATIFVDGAKADGTVSCIGGGFTPACDTDRVQISLASPPTSSGVHLLQLQNPEGLMTNELPIIVP